MQVAQDPVDEVLVFDSRGGLGRSTVEGADLDVDIEYSFEPLRSSNCCITFGRCVDFCVGGGPDAFPASQWRDEPATTVVRCQYCEVGNEIDPGT